MTDTWGAARSGGRTHEGIDIFARCGRPVVSATEGVVFQVGVNNLGGKVVWVLGPGGTYHYYAHLSRYAAKLPQGNRGHRENRKFRKHPVNDNLPLSRQSCRQIKS